MSVKDHPANAVYQFQNRKDRRSALKKVLDTQDDYQHIEACPYGCTGEDQDRLGYCKHLIGFVTDVKAREGALKAVPPNDPDVELVAKDPDEHGRRPIQPGKKTKLKVGDHLVRVTCSLRVYRQTAEATASTVPTKTDKPAPLG